MKYYDCDINEYKQIIVLVWYGIVGFNVPLDTIIIVLNDKCHAHVHYMALGMRGGDIYSGDGVKTGTKLVETG